MKKIILILIAIAVIISGCEKTTLKRIYGKYTINDFRVNEESHLNIYLDTLGPEYNFYYNDITYNYVCVVGEGLSHHGYTGHVIWTWELTGGNKIIKILSSSGAYYGLGPIGGTNTSEWEIQQLTKNVLIINTQYNNMEYLVCLQKL